MGKIYTIAGEELKELLSNYPTFSDENNSCKNFSRTLLDWPRTKNIEITDLKTSKTQKYSYPEKKDVESIIQTITTNSDLIYFIKGWSHQDGYFNLGRTISFALVKDYLPIAENFKSTFNSIDNGNIEFIEYFDILALLPVDNPEEPIKTDSSDPLVSITVTSRLSIGDDDKAKHEMVSYNIDVKDHMGYLLLYAISPIFNHLNQFKQELVELNNSMEKNPGVRENVVGMIEKIRRCRQDIHKVYNFPEEVKSKIIELEECALEKSKKIAIKNYSEVKGVFQNIVEGCRKLLSNLFPPFQCFNSKSQNMLLNTSKHKINIRPYLFKDHASIQLRRRNMHLRYRFYLAVPSKLSPIAK